MNNAIDYNTSTYRLDDWVQKRSGGKWRGKIVDSMTISYGCVRSLEEDWELVHDIEKEADRRMYASKARYYSDSGIDRRK